MRLRTRHVADSVVDRIAAVAERINSGEPIDTNQPPDIIAGAPQRPVDAIETPPDGLVQIAGDEAPAANLAPSELSSGIIQNAATGGNALDALLQEF